jgi:hypothetical protein
MLYWVWGCHRCGGIFDNPRIWKPDVEYFCSEECRNYGKEEEKEGPRDSE